MIFNALALAVITSLALPAASSAGTKAINEVVGPISALVKEIPAALEREASPAAETERRLDLQAAIELLKSQPGSWKVYRIYSPTCDAKSGNNGECRLLKAECNDAKKFAKKQKATAFCSSSFDATEVLLHKSSKKAK